MKRNALALAPLILLVLAFSGCTTFPFLDIFGGGTIEYTDDIIVIKSLQVTPGTTVKAGQTMTLYADIQNVQDPERAAGEIIPDVEVELYDHCTSLFENVEPAKQEKFDMSPKEIKTVSWTLTPREDVGLITQCELKVKVTYQYRTDTITSITFIDAAELESRIRRGESWQVSGSTTRGYGPVKVFLEVETQQPVSDETSASISMKIRNVGQGYVKDSAIRQNTNFIGDEDGFIPPRSTTNTRWEGGECDFQYTEITPALPESPYQGIKMVRKETTPKFCKLEAPGVDVEQTYDISSSVRYHYEFRRSIHVQIEPR